MYLSRPTVFYVLVAVTGVVLFSACSSFLFDSYSPRTSNAASASASAAAAAAAAGITSSSSSLTTSPLSTFLSLPYSSVSALSTSVISVLFSFHIISSQSYDHLLNILGTPERARQSASSASYRFSYPRYLSSSRASHRNQADDADDVRDADSARGPMSDRDDEKSTCSSGDGFMSCRSKDNVDNKDYNEVLNQLPNSDVVSFYEMMSEGQYAGDVCSFDDFAGCTVDSACFQLGLCTHIQSLQSNSSSSSSSSSSQYASSSSTPQLGLHIYKPPLVALPPPPQSSRLFASLLGPSSKTTLLLKAFAKSLYKFNNISMISSATNTADYAITHASRKPTLISTFTVLPKSTPVDSMERVSSSFPENRPQLIVSDELIAENSLSQPQPSMEPEEEIHLIKPVVPDITSEGSELNEKEPKRSKNSSKLKREPKIATRLNVQEVLNVSDGGSSSCLALVVAMVCFVAMGM
ncbi:uncharacterized protein V1516DRAFT_656695 [Lipomyces oligophaga]|uniref:uncharacterized protein n=1 Tax=Lipomyces oligophaga TaxID=45792 RepID=UPI0034CFA5F0